MTSINVYDAKAALFDRLVEASIPSPVNVDGSVQFAYTWPGPGNAGLDLVYGGGVRLSQADAVAEPNVLILEIAVVSLYVRVVRRMDDYGTGLPSVAETDRRVTEIVNGMGRHLAQNPRLTPELMWVGLDTGQGDHSATEDETLSILALSYKVMSTFGPSDG